MTALEGSVGIARQREYPVVIVGGGPGGSATALALRQRGVACLLVERDSFPRYHIGESLTGECAKHLRQLGVGHLLEGNPVKRGVLVWGREGQNKFFIPVAERTPEGRLQPSSTFQVTRAALDAGLLNEAKLAGAEVVQAEAARPILDGDRVAGVVLRTADGVEQPVRAGLVIDASGPACFLAQNGVIGPRERGTYGNQTAVFSQVLGSRRENDDTIILYREQNHWAWFIPLDAQRVSVGVVSPSSHLKEKLKTESLEAFFRREAMELNPRLTALLGPDWTLGEKVRTISNYSYRIPHFVGPGFACVGDAHRFIDPIFSFGMFFAIHEGVAVAEAAVKYLTDPVSLEPLRAFEAHAERGQDVINDLIDLFWARPLLFSMIVHGEHRDEFVDYFAGRIYGDSNRPGLTFLRERLASSRAHDAA